MAQRESQFSINDDTVYTEKAFPVQIDGGEGGREGGEGGRDIAALCSHSLMYPQRHASCNHL